MSQRNSTHETCGHLVRQDDPRRGPTRPICFSCFCMISDQAVSSIERRFFTVLSHSDFDTSQRYHTSLELAFALGRFEELELALREVASRCVLDHPTLFTGADIDSLVIATIVVFLSDTDFEYASEDAAAFIRERSLIFEMEAVSLAAARRQSTIADSGSIQLSISSDIMDNDALSEDLINGIDRISI